MEKLKEESCELTGLVLAGGLSSRLGRDKTSLALNDGETLLLRSVRLLRQVLPRVLVVGRTAPELTALDGVECVDDLAPGCGPVGGIYTGLTRSGTDCLVLSCDLPLMTQDLLEKLVSAWAARRPETLLCAYAQQETGKVENLVAVYSADIAELLKNRLDKRLLKIALITPAERTELIHYGFDDALPFFNINYPADLRLLLEYLG